MFHKEETTQQQLWWTSTGGKWSEFWFGNKFHLWGYLGYYIISGKTPVSHVTLLFAGSFRKQLLSRVISVFGGQTTFRVVFSPPNTHQVFFVTHKTQTSLRISGHFLGFKSFHKPFLIILKQNKNGNPEMLLAKDTLMHGGAGDGTTTTSSIYSSSVLTGPNLSTEKPSGPCETAVKQILLSLFTSLLL